LWNFKSIEEEVSANQARNLSILAVLLVLTRIPLLGITEPDSALFAIGEHQWLRGGRDALAIYSREVCATYYASMTALMHVLRLPDRDCTLVMSVVSMIACLGIILFAYLIGSQLVGGNAAFKGMLLFCLSPGLFWTSVEPHPQVLSLAFSIAAIWAFTLFLDGGRVWLTVLSALGFAISIAVKNDGVFVVPALFGVLLWKRPSWRNALIASAVGAGGLALALFFAHLALGSSSRAVSAGTQTAASYFNLPGFIGVVKQSAPIALGLGAITSLAIGFSLLRVFQSSGRMRWFMLLACWCLPGYIFWIFIGGNNIRHVLAFGVPLFWAAGRYLQMRWIVACLALTLLVPGNSNVFMFPSPNLPASARDFAAKKQQVAAVADRLTRQPSCFVGSYSNDYVIDKLLDAGATIESQADRSMSKMIVVLSDGRRVTFLRINPTLTAADIGACQSLEYDSAGVKTRFLGTEWHLPII
jgi:hypothetical protein